MDRIVFDAKERGILDGLTTPERIQDHLNGIPFVARRGKDTLMSPRRLMRETKAHCLEGALFAAAALWYHGEDPLLLDLRSDESDQDHVVALFRRKGLWGAVSKTNHAVLRYRDPVYRTLRELAMSYFHEYFLNAGGRKTLVAHSARPFSLRRYGTTWLTTEEDLWRIGADIDDAEHARFYPQGTKLRAADSIERRAGRIVERRG